MLACDTSKIIGGTSGGVNSTSGACLKLSARPWMRRTLHEVSAPRGHEPGWDVGRTVSLARGPWVRRHRVIGSILGPTATGARGAIRRLADQGCEHRRERSLARP